MNSPIQSIKSKLDNKDIFDGFALIGICTLRYFMVCIIVYGFIEIIERFVLVPWRSLTDIYHCVNVQLGMDHLIFGWGLGVL